MATRSATVKKPVKEVEEKIETKGKGKAPDQAAVKKSAIGKSKYSGEKVITLLVAYNPKRPSSESFKRFEKYEDEMTVADALKAGVSAGDLNWDVAHGFIKIDDEYDDDAEKKSKPEPKPRAPKEGGKKPARGKKKVDEDEDEDEDC